MAKEFQQHRSAINSFLNRLRKELNATGITVDDVVELLDKASAERLKHRELKADVCKVFGSVCVHALFGYTNECGRTRGVFGAVSLYAHPANQSCNNASKYVYAQLWCG